MADSSSTAAGCPPIEYHSRGRLGIGVTQHPGGNDYPLLAPSEDVRELLADFYLGYREPADYNRALSPFTPPFHIAWLHGFGCEDSAGSSDSSSAALNSVEIQIRDADGRLVFDSTATAPGGFAYRDWGPRLRIYEWSQADAVCRLVAHTKWAPTAPTREYANDIYPENGVLDSRTIERVPKQVTKLIVNGQEVTGKVVMAAGYNMQLAAAAKTDRQRGHEIRLAAIPGAGLGIYGDCPPPDRVIRTINGVQGNASGQFVISANGCYAIRPPTRIRDGAAALFARTSPYNTNDEDLPAADAGLSTAAAGWPQEVRESLLQLVNNCKACLDCEDFVDFAVKMNQLGDEYEALGVIAETLRDAYHAARARWQEYAACAAEPVKLYLIRQGDKLDVVVQYCNKGDECAHAVNLSVAFETSPAGEGIAGAPVDNFTQISGLSQIEGRKASLTEPYTMEGEWPSYGAFWDVVQPGNSSHVRFRLAFSAGGSDEFAVTATVSGSTAAGPINEQSQTVAIKR